MDGDCILDVAACKMRPFMQKWGDFLIANATTFLAWAISQNLGAGVVVFGIAGGL